MLLHSNCTSSVLNLDVFGDVPSLVFHLTTLHFHSCYSHSLHNIITSLVSGYEFSVPLHSSYRTLQLNNCFHLITWMIPNSFYILNLIDYIYFPSILLYYHSLFYSYSLLLSSLLSPSSLFTSNSYFPYKLLISLFFYNLSIFINYPFFLSILLY